MTKKKPLDTPRGEIHLHRGPVQPKASGWLLAVIVTGFIVSSMMIVQLSSQQYSKLLARKKFEASIEKRSWLEANGEFQVMTNRLSGLERVATEAIPSLFPDSSSQTKSASSIFTTISLINSGRFEQAAERFRSERDAWHKTSLERSENLNPQTKSELTELLDRIEKKFSVLNQMLSDQNLRYRRISRLEESMDNSGELFRLLSRDVADLLYLPVTKAGENELFKTYQTGSLKGLPVLPEIRDNLNSLEELQEELAAAGTRLPIRRTGDWEEFLATVESLRLSAAEIVAAHNSEKTEKLQTKAEISATSIEIQKTGNEINTLASQVMFLNLPKDTLLLGTLTERIVDGIVTRL